MNRRISPLAHWLLWSLPTLMIGGMVLAAPTPDVTEDVFKDRATFIPSKIAPKPGKVIGLLITDANAVIGRDGRQGSPSQFAFSTADQNYDWVHISWPVDTFVSEWKVRTGEKGDTIKVFNNLTQATPDTVKEKFGFSARYALVEMEINEGLGAPGRDWMVATQMKRLDHTREYPLDVPEVVAQMRRKYDAWLRDQELSMNDKMDQAQKQYLKETKPTGPRQTTTIMYLTWLPASQRLSARFLTRIADGAFEDGKAIEPASGERPGLPGGPERSSSRTAPGKFRHGTEFGIEFGLAYEVSKSGSLERTLKLPVESFEHKVLAPLLPQKPEK